MKVLMVSTVEVAKNGISTCILNYHETLEKLGVQVDIVAPNEVSADIKKNWGKGTLFELSNRKESTFKYFKDLIKIIKTYQYDIVHVHGNSCTMAIELVAAFCGGCRNRIAHSHNTTCEHKKLHYMLKPLFQLMCTQGFACGKEAGEWLFENREFTVIRNGIDTDKFLFNAEKRKKYRNSLKLDENTVLIGHVGLFNYQKNHEYLIRIFNEIAKRNLGYKLILLGDGELRAEIEKEIREKGLEKSVICMGNVTDVSGYLQAIDLFVLPSRFEGLPYVLVEAQASGLPCIVSDVITREANLTGLVEYVSLADEGQWVKKILEIREERRNDERIKGMIKAEGYDIAENGMRLKEIYTKLSQEKK